MIENEYPDMQLYLPLLGLSTVHALRLTSCMSLAHPSRRDLLAAASAATVMPSGVIAAAAGPVSSGVAGPLPLTVGLGDTAHERERERATVTERECVRESERESERDRDRERQGVFVCVRESKAG